jgi:hypothetical protein
VSFHALLEALGISGKTSVSIQKNQRVYIQTGGHLHAAIPAIETN